VQLTGDDARPIKADPKPSNPKLVNVLRIPYTRPQTIHRRSKQEGAEEAEEEEEEEEEEEDKEEEGQDDETRAARRSAEQRERANPVWLDTWA